MRTTELALALITGITGRDGSYLVELLLSKGYEVHGVVWRTSSLNRSRIDHLKHGPPAIRGPLGFHLHYGDLTGAGSLQRLVRAVKPTEVNNLAAQSQVGVSLDRLGTIRLLEAFRGCDAPIRDYQASTSELFGATPPPQNQKPPGRPRSPYAAVEPHAHWMTVYYREAYGIFACNGTLFNPESPRRGENFVTRKTTRDVAASIKAGTNWWLGSLEARRNWSHARDYVETRWLMLQKAAPSDYVIGTGITPSVQDLVELAFGLVGLDWHDHVELDPVYVRPSEVPERLADPSKAKRELGWYPRTGFEEMIREMLEVALRAAGVEPRQYICDTPTSQAAALRE
jgi:GDPmannose 4,6-dehydratase